jgi:hypothetical protein
MDYPKSDIVSGEARVPNLGYCIVPYNRPVKTDVSISQCSENIVFKKMDNVLPYGINSMCAKHLLFLMCLCLVIQVLGEGPIYW